MNPLEVVNDHYNSPRVKSSLFAKIFPSVSFYIRFIGIIFSVAGKCKRGMFSEEVWQRDSMNVLRQLERVGVRLEISGMEYLEASKGPCVYVGNHMSIMETLLLPSILLPYGSMTFVVKEGLLHYPVFKHVMRACKPVAVTRTNPRQDLKTVMSEGVEKISAGTSIIVFPQTTRSLSFDPEQFGSIGTKLAKKAAVPIIPIALKTDAWRNGRISKDFGRLYPEIPVKIAFGEPITIAGKGTEEQQQVLNFLSAKLDEWTR